MAVATIVGILAIDVAGATLEESTAIAIASIAVHAARLWTWYTDRIWSVPILWILHLGYAWIVVRRPAES